MATNEQLSASFSQGSEVIFEYCCSPCSKDGIIVEAITECLDCNYELFCGKCINFHNKLGITSGHKVVDMKFCCSPCAKDGIITDAVKQCLDCYHELFCGKCINFHNKLSITSGHKVVDKPRICKLEGEYKIKVKTDTSTCISLGSCLLPDGTVMVTDWNNTRLKRLDASYNVTDHCDVPAKPYGVTCTAPDEVAVTLRDQKKVQFVSVRDSMSLARSFSTSDSCRGVVSSKEELFVSCGGFSGEGPGHVAVHSFNGTRLRTLQTGPSGEQLFSEPRHITASADSARIYVADDDKGVVSSDRSGKSVSSFTDPSWNGASGVCTLDNGNVLVSGYNSHNVLQFDCAGRYLGEVLSRADDTRLPMSLSYDSSRSRLIVTMNVSENIKVFDLV